MHESVANRAIQGEYEMEMKSSADAALPYGESFARKVLLSSLSGIYVYDLKQGINVFINPEYTKLTGYTLNDLTAISGAEFFALFHPEDQPRVAAHMQRVLGAEDGEILEIDYRFKAADGRWIWCFSRDTVLEREADGSVRQLIGTFLDISKRKTVEMDLLNVTRQKEETLALLDALFESAPIGLVFCDRNLRFVKLNRMLAEINGVPVEYHLGKTPEEVVPDVDEIRPLMAMWRKIVETGKSILDFEVSGETPANPGQKRYWSDNFFPVKVAGETIGVAATIMDITERKKAAETLQESHIQLEEMVRKRTALLKDTVTKLEDEIVERKRVQTQLQQLSWVFRDAADPILIEDLSGTIIEINREAERSYGWSRDELIGKSIKSLLLPERYQFAWKLRERCLNGQEVRNWEGVRVDKYGRAFPVLVTAFPLVDENGNIESLATITKDISLLKNMESELRDSQRRLQKLSRKSIEALEVDRRTVSRELHDSIGGNLAAIRFALEAVVKMIAEKPDSAAEFLEKAISQLAETIKECKRLSVNLRPSVLDDMGLISTIDWHARQLGQHYGRIQVIQQIDVTEQEIPEAFKIVIYRVIQEALNNAARHSLADTVYIRLKRSGNYLETEVEDNGHGFDLEQVYERGDHLSGLGLRSMQERVEIIGGSFSVHSRFGAGTRIRITLPMIEYKPI
jgi:PAS domain S-box-containing protein